MPNVDGPGGGGGGDEKSDCCERTEDKKAKQKKEKTAWGKSGIIKEHQGKIQAAATDLKVVLYFRKTKSECEPWIRDKHHPKPHSVLAGTTITAASVPTVQAWLDNYFKKMSPKVAESYPKIVILKVNSSNFYGRKAEEYIGVIGSTQEGQEKGKPLQGFGKYKWKWMTGDYDLFQVLKADGKCTAVTGDDFAKVKNEINKRLKWDAIQHGPQAQWCPTSEELDGLPPFKMPDLVKEGLRNGTNPARPFAKGRDPMKALDSPLTVVAGEGVTMLEEEKDVRDSLICQGCAE